MTHEFLCCKHRHFRIIIRKCQESVRCYCRSWENCPWETRISSKELRVKFAMRNFCTTNSATNFLGTPSPRSSRRWNFEISITGAVPRHGVINWEEFGEKFRGVILHSQWSTKMPRKFRPKFRPIFRPTLHPECRPLIKICRHNFALGNVRRLISSRAFSSQAVDVCQSMHGHPPLSKNLRIRWEEARSTHGDEQITAISCWICSRFCSSAGIGACPEGRVSWHLDLKGGKRPPPPRRDSASCLY